MEATDLSLQLTKLSCNSLKTATSFTCPVNLTLMKYLFEALEPRGRAKRMNNLSEPIEVYESFSRPLNVVLRPEVQWSFNSIMTIIGARTFMSSSLSMPIVINTLLVDSSFGSVVRTLGGRGTANSSSDNAKSQIRTASELAAATPALICRSVLTQFRKNAILLDKSNSEMKISEETPASNVDSSRRYDLCESMLTANDSMMKGQIRYQWKSGTPYFVFTVGDDFSEVYLSRPWKIESSMAKGKDYIYLFHSISVNKFKSEKYVADALEILGKMKVSSLLTFGSDGSRTRETEFVLYNANAKTLLGTRTSGSLIKKAKELGKRVTNILKPSRASKNDSICSLNELSSFFRSYDETKLTDQVQNDCTPEHELAAVVLRDHKRGCDREAAVGGWGLKFLGISNANDVDASSTSSISQETCNGSRSISRHKSSKNLTVLVPADLHGSPSIETGGPSGIITRWQTGGQCDCGGWDVGCSIQVLSCNSITKNATSSLKEELQDHNKSVDLFTEGSMRTESTMKIVDMNDGLYAIYFHPSLSDLQAFSIGVAMIHAQSPSLNSDF
ncbi:uncharacterized protein LOC141844516 [Curcuma longa]|uniref:uncharacterized protein LOC141844516 n=1 Tax=Curcuma longa TaxID=136217 RepID=UPI003D9E79ED